MYDYLRASLLFFLPILLWTACEEGEFFGPKPFPFPPITTTGAHTIGCKVNGEVFVRDPPKAFSSSSLRSGYGIYSDCYHIRASRRTSDNRVRVLALRFNGPVVEGLHDFSELAWSDSDFCTRYGDHELEHLVESEPYELNILHVDTLQRIVSGTFHFTLADAECQDTFRITDGRFDLRFHN